METFGKVWTLNQMTHKTNAYIFALAGAQLLNSDAILSLRGKDLVLFEDSIHFLPEGKRSYKKPSYIAPLRDMIRNYGYRNVTIEHKSNLSEVRFNALRNMWKECFELVNNYGKHTGLQPLLREQDWYHFSRVIRNAITHDFHYDFSKNDLPLLPLVFEGSVIRYDMQGKPISESFINPRLAISVVQKMRSFVTDSPILQVYV